MKRKLQKKKYFLKELRKIIKNYATILKPLKSNKIKNRLT